MNSDSVFRVIKNRQNTQKFLFPLSSSKVQVPLSKFGPKNLIERKLDRSPNTRLVYHRLRRKFHWTELLFYWPNDTSRRRSPLAQKRRSMHAPLVHSTLSLLVKSTPIEKNP